MDFEKFGIRSFVAETKARDFVAYLEQGKVMATRCMKCGRITFPPKIDCTTCWLSEVEWVEMKETGQLKTFTVVMYGPAGFEKETPYTLGLVQFPTGIRVFAQLDKGIPAEEIKAGMNLKVAPVKLAENRFSYQFQKA